MYSKVSLSLSKKDNFNTHSMQQESKIDRNTIGDDLISLVFKNKDFDNQNNYSLIGWQIENNILNNKAPVWNLFLNNEIQ
jgi:hypothetical protein